ncbi:MAG: biotin--[acetyl-CoA-carboxylase] ligase [Alphaproteobacteria bacterium]|nr:biotin--[acetyl-CoA-carboxylase] ligase [Alphaproteobacteria bacterium]
MTTTPGSEANLYPPGWAVQRFDTVGSTMDIARDLADHNAPDRTVIRADIQTGGRGRYGRQWFSEPGNLYMSLLLRENRSLADCAQLSFAAALALYDAIALPGTTLKWPNDVLIGGKKTAGILLEAGGPVSSPWLLIGMGVNVAHHPDGSPYPATHLAQEGNMHDADAVCRAVLESIDHWREIWHKQGATPIHAAWLDKAHGRGQDIRVRLSSKEIRGRFETLDADGALVVLDEAGTRHRISAGDVFFA